MIKDWRKKWHEKTNKSTNPNFPFGFVQLANGDLDTNRVGNYPWVRWHQTADFGYSPNPKLQNVFMTTAVDLVDNGPDPIHPRFKEDIGIRLSRGALKLGYSKNVEYSPPRVKSIDDSNSNIEIVFETDYGKIDFNVKNKNGFELCCDSDKCMENDYENWFQLKDFEVKNEKIILKKPNTCNLFKYVRYLWREKPCEFKLCPLYTQKTDLPVYPFIGSVYKSDSSILKCYYFCLYSLFIFFTYFIFES